MTTKWTTKVPEEYGWYWMRDTQDPDHELAIAIIDDIQIWCCPQYIDRDAREYWPVRIEEPPATEVPDAEHTVVPVTHLQDKKLEATRERIRDSLVRNGLVTAKEED